MDLIELGPHALIAVAPSGLLLRSPMKERIELGRWSALYLQPLPVGERLEYPSCRRFLWVSVEVPQEETVCMAPSLGEELLCRFPQESTAPAPIALTSPCSAPTGGKVADEDVERIA